MLSQDDASKAAALAALAAYPQGLHVGGGITAENAGAYLDAGASHVIVTSYVFREGKVDEERLSGLVRPARGAASARRAAGVNSARLSARLGLAARGSGGAALRVGGSDDKKYIFDAVPRTNQPRRDDSV
jgi:hypothetical protein